MHMKVRLIRYCIFSVFTLVAIAIPFKMIFANFATDEFKVAVLGEYSGNSNIAFINDTDQVAYIVFLNESPWVIAAVGFIENGTIVKHRYSAVGTWIILAAYLFTLLISYMYWKNSILGSAYRIFQKQP